MDTDRWTIDMSLRPRVTKLLEHMPPTWSTLLTRQTLHIHDVSGLPTNKIQEFRDRFDSCLLGLTSVTASIEEPIRIYMREIDDYVLAHELIHALDITLRHNEYVLHEIPAWIKWYFYARERNDGLPDSYTLTNITEFVAGALGSSILFLSPDDPQRNPFTGKLLQKRYGAVSSLLDEIDRSLSTAITKILAENTSTPHPLPKHSS